MIEGRSGGDGRRHRRARRHGSSRPARIESHVEPPSSSSCPSCSRRCRPGPPARNRGASGSRRGPERTPVAGAVVVVAGTTRVTDAAGVAGRAGAGGGGPGHGGARRFRRGHRARDPGRRPRARRAGRARSGADPRRGGDGGRHDPYRPPHRGPAHPGRGAGPGGDRREDAHDARRHRHDAQRDGRHAGADHPRRRSGPRASASRVCGAVTPGSSPTGCPSTAASPAAWGCSRSRRWTWGRWRSSKGWRPPCTGPGRWGASSTSCRGGPATRPSGRSCSTSRRGGPPTACCGCRRRCPRRGG